MVNQIGRTEHEARVGDDRLATCLVWIYIPELTREVALYQQGWQLARVDSSRLTLAPKTIMVIVMGTVLPPVVSRNDLMSDGGTRSCTLGRTRSQQCTSEGQDERGEVVEQLRPQSVWPK